VSELAPDDAIAIVGAAVHVPQADTIEAFIDIVLDGREALTEVPADADPASQPDLVTRRPILTDVEAFDPEYFGYSRREAVAIDPQHRHFLMCCRSLLYSSGTDHKRLPRIGVIASCDENQYLSNVLTGHVKGLVSDFERYVSSDKDFLATRVSYALGLTGPAFTVQTACSSSLVAAHLAVQSLIRDECDACIAGGVSIQIPHGRPYRYVSDMIYSPDGSCRPFDAGANGTNLGSGAAAVLLKRLPDAVKNCDRVVAIIRASRLNNDGRRKMSYTAPSPSGQQDVLIDALRRSRINVEHLKFVETHGTATKLGDPVEFAALKAAVAKFTGATNFCALTGIKANFGHLSCAAGVAGLIKAALCLERRVVPPLTNFTKPSDLIRLEGSAFRTLDRAERYEDVAGAAIVSSFGIGGTNAVMVLEGHSAGEEPRARRDGEQACLVTMSDDKPAHLSRNLHRLAEQLRRPERDPRRFTGMARRLSMSGRYRGTVVMSSHGQTTVFSAPTPKFSNACACFVFPGQGMLEPSAYLGMYRTSRTFQAHLDHCEARFCRHAATSFRDLYWSNQAPNVDLADPLVAHPFIFSAQVALAETLKEFGFAPRYVLGHSLGEFAALTIGGRLGLDDAVRLVWTRANTLARAPKGRMLVVSGVDRDIARSFARDGVYVAAENGPRQIVFSGEAEPILNLERDLKLRLMSGGSSVNITLLPNNRPSHTPLIAPYLEELKQEAASVRLHDGLAVISTLTGKPFDAGENFVDYLCRQITGTVRFADALDHAASDGANVFVEIGHSFTTNHMLGGGTFAVPALDKIEGEDQVRFLSSVGKLWAAGLNGDIERVVPEGGPAEFLPPYAFATTRCWPETAAVDEKNGAARDSENAISPARPPTSPDGQASGADEHKIVAAFRSALGDDSLDRESDFFAHGGHSLLAVSVCAKMREEDDVPIDLATLFALRTPRRIHEWLVAGGGRQ